MPASSRRLEEERLARVEAEGKAREAWRAAATATAALEDKTSVVCGLQLQVQELQSKHAEHVRRCVGRSVRTAQGSKLDER